MVYAALVASHRGEFWPFSIYPMFSGAGKPWTRALVREIEPPVPGDSLLWQPARLSTLPGQPVPLDRHGIKQNDLANFVSKTTSWDITLQNGLRRMFSHPPLSDRHLLVMRAQGRLLEDDSIDVDLEPFLLLTPESLRFNPNLDIEVEK